MKNGITFISLVIYVGLFFTFAIVASNITTNLNKSNFKDSGYVEVSNNYLKLYANMFNSAKNSNKFNYLDNEYIFSNGDVYHFDKENNLIRKNNSVLCYNFTEIKVNKSENIDFNVKFTSFGNNIDKQIILNVGEN